MRHSGEHSGAKMCEFSTASNGHIARVSASSGWAVMDLFVKKVGHRCAGSARKASLADLDRKEQDFSPVGVESRKLRMDMSHDSVHQVVKLQFTF
jgi:hypothetical protein